MKKNNQYMVGNLYRGRVIPIGWSKNWKYALDIAIKHKARIFELKEIKEVKGRK